MTEPVDDATPTVRTISGTVTYRERVALPPGAVVTVRVLDVSRADAPATVLAAGAFAVEGQVPVPYALTVDAADVGEQAMVTVWARLRSAVGTWQTDTHNAVLTRGAGDSAELVVRRIGDGVTG